jgi:fructoselysine-6-P-deglycase FrlB-like protein
MSVSALVFALVSNIVQEIGSQPACWAEAVRLAPEAAEKLPQQGERIAAVGCGTSFYMAQAYSGIREAAGHGPTDPFPASEFPAGRSYDGVVALSRSGTTTEVVRLLERLGGGVATVAISAVPDSPVVTAASAAVLLEFADERSVVQTRFATTTLALLRSHAGEDLTRANSDGEEALRSELPADPEAFDHFVFLGRGWTVGLANEAALKMREAAGSWAESYPAMEYRHGPISVAGSRSLVWALGDVEEDVLRDVERTGATVVRSTLDPMAELVKVHRMAVALAEMKGLDPDHPRHLTRSVVLS